MIWNLAGKITGIFLTMMNFLKEFKTDFILASLKSDRILMKCVLVKFSENVLPLNACMKITVVLNF